MKKVNYSVGLDIGTTKIVAIIGRENEYGKIEILGIGKSKSLGVHRGVVNNIVRTIESIKQAVEDAERKSGLKISEVVAGIAGQHIHSLQHSDYITRINSEEVINESDMDNLCDQVHKLVMLPGEEIIHVLPLEYKVDGQTEIKEPMGMYGGRLEANFHVIVGQVSSIKNIIGCVKDAKLNFIDIILEPLASANAVLSQEEKEAGVALIDIGGGTTDLAIFKDGLIRHTAVIPFGGNIITKDIMDGCSIIERHAESLKIKYGSALLEKKCDDVRVAIEGVKGRRPKEITLDSLSKIIRCRAIEIIEWVYMEIKNYGYDEQKKKLILGIVLTGGGSQLKHLDLLVESITGMDTRIGYPNEHLAGDSDREVTKPLYATAVGLLMNSIESSHKNNIEQESGAMEEEDMDEKNSKKNTVKKERENFFARGFDKLKIFLDMVE